MKYLVLALMTIGLIGCSAKSQWGEADTGGAVYSYQSTNGQKSCVINGTSAREVGGLDIEIGEDCSMKITTDHSTPLGDGFNVLQGMVDKMPDLSVMP